MKIFKHTLWILAVVLFASCDLTPDVAPVPHADLKANTTIAELLAMHEIGSLDSYIHIPDTSGIIITGIVTTSDKHGNCYKYINIEDGTGGIQIKINNTALYNKFKVGQRIYVKCSGLDLGDYRKLPQLGIWANDAMQAGGKVLVLATRATLSLEKYSRLKSLYGEDVISVVGEGLVELVEGGMATYCAPNAATSRDIEMIDGTTITMRTSNYADFINEMLPTGSGTVIGILTRYNNTVQIVIRDLNDVMDFVTPPHTEDVFTVNYSTAFNDGWQRITSGSEWSVLANTSFTGFFINSNNGSSDSWLISPTIDLTDAESPEIHFDHRIAGTGGSTGMTLYYTNNYTGDPTSTSWTELPVYGFNSSNLTSCICDLQDCQLTPNFRIAFRYNGSNSSWYITNLHISAIVY